MVRARAAQLTEELEVRPEDLGPLVATAHSLRRRPGGWLHLQPGVPEETVPPPPRGLALLLAGSAPGPAPVATWVPGAVRRRIPGSGRQAVDQLGIQHGLAVRARPRLAEAGLWPPPAGWLLRQDDPRRGLVLEVRPEVELEQLLRWLLRATEALSGLPVSGRWRALVFRRAD
ncbi:hypothetical protein ACFFRE_10255 [Aciditerrimonas ferrireducens]|uniref:Uncharacterized protein n=1 Tax=Aciditerrimonas ferrireducens TaxID=667306 RepID=A0ABV6C6R0_9ACTN